MSISHFFSSVSLVDLEKVHVSRVISGGRRVLRILKVYNETFSEGSWLTVKIVNYFRKMFH